MRKIFAAICAICLAGAMLLPAVAIADDGVPDKIQDQIQLKLKLQDGSCQE